MKSTVLLIGFMLLAGILPGQVPKPAKPAYVVNYEQKGKNANDSWEYNAVIKFSLSNWNSSLQVRELITGNRIPQRVFNPGAFLKLDPGEKVIFYPSEIDESGSGGAGSYSHTLTTDGVETITESSSSGTKTEIITDADYREKHNIPLNEVYNMEARFYQLGNLAELERTATGGILWAYTAVGNNMGEWSVPDEVWDQVYPEVAKFVLTENEIRNWPQISKTNVKSESNDEDQLTIRLSVNMEIPEEAKVPEVTLEGCSEMGVGETGQVSATGKPEGGHNRYWVEPSDMFQVTSNSTSASLTGSSPGRGTLFVEYTSPEGKTAQTSQPATCIKIESYNGGEAIPEIVFYDINGKRLPNVLKVAVDIQPSEAADLVRFEPADPGVITVQGLGSQVNIQGIREGKTTFQAKSPCGSVIGPVAEVEVYVCSEETRARIAAEEKAALETLKEKTERYQDLINSEDFKNGTTRTAESAANLTLKLSALIFGTVGVSPGASATVESASKVFGVGSNVLDIFKGGDFSKQAMNSAQLAVELFGNYEMQALAGAWETIDAAQDFGIDLRGLQWSLDNLKDVYQDFEQFNRYLDDLVRRKRLCENGGEQPQGQEQAQAGADGQPAKTAPPKESTSKAGESSGEVTSVETPDTGEANDGDPDVTDPPAKETPPGETPPKGTEIPPTPPTTEVGFSGLPFQSGECGCNNTRTVTAGEDAFVVLLPGVKNLGECTGKFAQGPLADYTKALEEWKVVTEKLDSVLKAGAEEAQKSAGTVIPLLESLLGRTKSFDEAGQSFLGEFEKCPESLKAGIGEIQSAINVTLDMIKTKY